MRSLLGRSSARFYARHPWQFALALAGIALGVAVFVGIQLANDSARRAFDLSANSARSYATHRMLPVAEDIEESIYRELVRSGQVDDAEPIIESQVTVTSSTGTDTVYPLLGVDPLKEGRFRHAIIVTPDPAIAVQELLVVPLSVLLPEALAEELGLTRGSRISLSAAGRAHRATVIGTIRSIDNDPGSRGAIITDIASAQQIADRAGRLSRIELALSGAQAKALGSAPPPGTAVVAADDGDGTLAQMTRAFTTNLTALGLLALVVGMFLIHSTMSFAVVQRRKSLAVLRALGMTRAEVLKSLLVEGAAIGCLAGIAGVAIGHFLATGLMDLVLRTMGDLAFSRALRGAPRSVWIYVIGLILGVTVTVVAALIPALEAASQQPAQVERRSALERAARRQAHRIAMLAVPTLAIAAGLLLWSAQSLVPAFIALFLVLGAGAMCVPLATIILMRGLEPVVRLSGGLAGTMAVRGVTDSLSRTGVATTALTVAVATVMSIGLMIGSFRSSLIEWIDSTLTADLYLAIAPDREAAVGDADWVAAIEALPEIRGTSLSRRSTLPSEYGEIGIRAATPGPDGWGLDLVGAAEQGWEEKLRGSDRVIVSEPFAYRHSLQTGDSVVLPTQSGNRTFRISGIVRDYNAAGNAVVMGLETYHRHWRDPRISGIGLHLAEGADPDRTKERVLSVLPRDFGARVRSTAMIERLSLTIFDRTFEVTSVLRTLAGFVAFLGVLSAILALQLEREREFAVLRSIGMSLAELRLHIVAQTGLLGLAAGLIAIPLGCALAWMLVYVINRRSFGWSMDFIVSVPPVFYGVAIAIGAALLAGFYAALFGMRPDPGKALHDE